MREITSLPKSKNLMNISASFQSSPKLNHMLVTTLMLCKHVKVVSQFRTTLFRLYCVINLINAPPCVKLGYEIYYILPNLGINVWGWTHLSLCQEVVIMCATVRV